MENVLYEYSGYSFSLVLLLPFFGAIFGIIFLIHSDSLTIIRGMDGEKLEKRKKAIRLFICVWTVCVIMIGVIVSVAEYNEYKTIAAVMENGNYQTVEGYVENFDPMPPEGHKRESFIINGVNFSYSDSDVMQGYHQAKSKGGVITGDGQHLEIRYTNYRKNNVILYIKQLDEVTEDFP